MTIQADRHQRVRLMLERYRQAIEAGGIGNAFAEAPDSRLLLFPPEFNDAMRELDRCLSKMRRLGDQQAINGVPLRKVHWHVKAWFVDVTYRQAPVYERKLVRLHGPGPKHAWTKKIAGYRLEPQRHRDASERKAELGIPWLAREFDWDRIHLRAILDACGEHTEKAAA